MCKKLLLLLLLLPFQLLSAQTKLLTDFPEGYTPEEVGKRLAYRFEARSTHFMPVNGLDIRKHSTGMAR